MTQKNRVVPVALGFLMLAVVACTCGPLSQIQQTVEDVQEIQEGFEEMQPAIEQGLTQAAESGEVPGLPEDFEMPEIDMSEAESCTYLTDAEAEDVLGQTPSFSVFQMGGSVCTWTTESGTSVSVTIQDLGTTAALDMAFNAQTLGGDFEEVDGAGAWDKAILDNSNTLMIFQKGTILGVVTAVNMDREAVIDLALLVASRVE